MDCIAQILSFEQVNFRQRKYRWEALVSDFKGMLYFLYMCIVLLEVNAVQKEKDD